MELCIPSSVITVIDGERRQGADEAWNGNDQTPIMTTASVIRRMAVLQKFQEA
jgi:hypothetical protein